MRWFVALGLTVFAGCSQAPSEDQCKRLLDHVVELELKQIGGSGGGLPAEATDAFAKMKLSVGNLSSSSFLDGCTTKVSKARVECALEATSVECPDGKSDCGSLADCDAK
jgi:hypothetical protein|nr:hypothetical protein [Kofleriaceae bacterium]